VKPWIVPLIMILILPALAGCPVESHLPIAESGQHPIDMNLVGDWTGVSADGDSSAVVVIPFNKFEYYVETTEKPGARDRFRAFVFDVDGLEFLQVNEIGIEQSSGGYVFARLEFLPDGTVSIKFVGEQLVPKTLADDPKAILAIIEKNSRNEALYDAETALRLRR
jgi:hypothetical protein